MRMSAPYEELTNGELEDWVYSMPSFLPCGKAGGLQILRCQRLAVADYSCAIDALTLEPSDFCNIGVYSILNYQHGNGVQQIVLIHAH